MICTDIRTTTKTLQVTTNILNDFAIKQECMDGFCANAKPIETNLKISTQVLKAVTQDLKLATLLVNGFIVNVNRIDNIKVNAQNIEERLKVVIQVMCSENIHELDYELFLVHEGYFIFADGKQFKVLRYELSE